MRKLLLVTALLFTSLTALTSVDFRDFDMYQELLTQKEVQKKIERFLEKNSSIKKNYQLNEKELRIGEVTSQKYDYILRLRSSPQAKSLKKKSLKGARIAIDPGHFGGLFAKLEHRFVYMETKAPSSKIISFDEGTLTYLTALKLKALFEAEGAIVFLTREGISQGCLKETFFEWLQAHPRTWESKDSLSELFRRYYNREDMAARAKAINDFKPDLTLIIHYNAGSGVEKKPSSTYATQANYNMAFIAGAFGKGDLDLPEERYEFLRMIVTEDLEESLKLSKHITTQFTRNLKVPLIADTQKEPYEPALCIKQAEGVYSRNLFLTRYIHGPICYGETLIQNNVEEIHRLSAGDSEVNGIVCSKRVIEVAEAYFKGVQDYFKQNGRRKKTNTSTRQVPQK